MEFMNPRIIVRAADCLERSHDVHFIVTLIGAVERESETTRYAVDTRIREYACNTKWDIRTAVRYLQANMTGMKPRIVWRKPVRKKAGKRCWPSWLTS